MAADRTVINENHSPDVYLADIDSTVAATAISARSTPGSPKSAPAPDDATVTSFSF